MVDECLPLAEIVLRCSREMHGDADHMDTAEALNNKGIILARMSNMKESEEALEAALAMKRKLVGDADKVVAGSLRSSLRSRQLCDACAVLRHSVLCGQKRCATSATSAFRPGASTRRTLGTRRVSRSCGRTATRTSSSTRCRPSCGATTRRRNQTAPPSTRRFSQSSSPNCPTAARSRTSGVCSRRGARGFRKGASSRV
eukprot:3172218-Rhodomonas_salina.2